MGYSRLWQTVALEAAALDLGASAESKREWCAHPWSWLVPIPPPVQMSIADINGDAVPCAHYEVQEVRLHLFCAGDGLAVRMGYSKAIDTVLVYRETP